VHDLWGDAHDRTRVPVRLGDIHHEALRLQASESGDAIVISGLLQWFLQWAFIGGVFALVLTCLLLTGCARRYPPVSDLRTTGDTTSAEESAAVKP
jgi:hypothetical protein